MIIDCHWHTTGRETVEEIAEGIEKAGLDRAVLFAPYLAQSDKDARAGMPMEEANRWMGEIARELPDAVIGFAWIEPNLPGAVEEVDRCISEYGLCGVKMIPNHWYPTDEAVFPVYEKIQELQVPMICHSGILYGYQDGSRFCRPVLYEALINFPGVRFALAHIGWPWVDECLAVFGRFRAQWQTYQGKRPEIADIQMFIDVTPGTPPIWRADALRKAVAFVGEDRLIWGSDASPLRYEYAARVLESDRRILSSQIGLPSASQDKILGGNLERFLAPPAG